MLTIKATLVGTKQPKQLKVSSREELLKQIQNIFNINPSSVTIMKPQVKDEQSFKKNVREGTTIIFKGHQKKHLTRQQQQKLQQQKEKQARAIQQAKKKVYQMNINAHQKIIQKLNKQQIQERGFSHMNQNGYIEKLNTDHYTAPVHLMRIVPEFRKYCVEYKVQPKNPDGLLIEELGKTFKLLSGESEKIVDPLDWCSAFLAYCTDQIEYPYPTYDFNYIINKIFSTIHNAHLTQLERRKEGSQQSGIRHSGLLFGTELNVKKMKLTKLDEDDFQFGKEVDKRQYRYVLECDISDPLTLSYEDGIKKRFEEKVVWQSFHLFDLEFKERIISIEKNPKYLFVHVNRVGYPPAKDQSQEIVLLPIGKSIHRVRTKRIIDITELSSNLLREKFENGKFEKYQLFYKLGVEKGYQTFIQKLKKKSNGMNIEQQYSDSQLKYMYLDDKLLNYDIFHEYYFDQLKGSKPTGEYRLMGVVYHRGRYYHHPDPTHTVEIHGHTKEECRGEFIVMVYRRGREWLKFDDGEIEKVEIEEVLDWRYWGGGEWTPVLCLYREISIKNVEIQMMGDD